MDIGERVDTGRKQDSAEPSLPNDNIDSASLERKLEAIMMVTAEPLTPLKAAQVLEISPTDAEMSLESLYQRYLEKTHGFSVQRVAGGYRFATSPDLYSIVEAFALSQSSARLSMAALETLAIVAYRQPISRGQIANIRGVNSDSVLKMLLARGYVEANGKDSGPGGALLYRTTSTFLEKLGIYSLEELPPIEGFIPGSEVAEALEMSLFSD